MNSDYYRREAQRFQQEIARLQRDKSSIAGRVADAQRKANSAVQSAARASSPSSASSYQREAQRQQDEVAKEQKKLADSEDKIAREQARRNDAVKSQTREEERERREREREDDRRQKEAERRQKEADRRQKEGEERMRQISGKLTQHDVLHRQTLSTLERLAQLPERIVVLFMASNPVDQAALRLDEETRAIAEMIRKSANRDSVKLESWWAVRPLDVLQAINEHKPRVIHFSGHGSNQSEIVFQDDAGQTKLVSKEAIVQTMAAASGDIQLVFFNTCYSRDQAEAVVRHLPAAIGMNSTIGDEAARVFAAQFYSAIGFGLSVRRAFEQAKAALLLESIAEDDVPELFVGAGVDAEALVLVKPPQA